MTIDPSFRLRGGRRIGAALLAATAAGCLAAGPETPPDPVGLRYEVAIDPRGDRADLVVTATFAPDGGGPVEIAAPPNCYGPPNLDATVVEMTGLEGTRVLDADAPGRWRALPGPDGAVTIRYRRTYDPALMTAAFAPNVGPGHLHVGGCQWMLRFGDPDAPRRTVVALAPPPDGWSVYSNLAPNDAVGDVVASANALNATAIGAETAAVRRFEVRGQPVEVYVAEALLERAPDLADWVRDTVAYQRERMQAYDFPFYVVALRPREDVLAGTAIENLFVAFMRPEADREGMIGLISHEMFHNFITQRLAIDIPDEQVRHEWFNEGFVEYLSRRLLLDMDAIDRDAFAAQLNDDLIDLAVNPWVDWRMDDLVAASADGRYSQSMKRLSYDRGALMAANWDRRLASAGRGDLADVIAAMIADAADAGPDLPEDAFFALATRHGLAIENDYVRHVLNAEPLAPDPDLLGPDFERVEVVHETIDYGFDFALSYREREIAGVDPGGPAHAAGLRDGMDFLSADNSNPRSPGWKPDAPLVVRVRDAGEERRIAYAPARRTVTVHQFRRTPPAGK